jgi:hypothetical protein
MRSGIILAWLVGEGIIVWRSVARDHRPPMPGTLLVSSGLFALLAVLAEYEPARGAATTLAFAFDLAAYLNAPGFGQGPAAAVPATTTPGQRTAPVSGLPATGRTA